VLRLILRFVLLIVGGVLLLDAALPLRSETLQVDQHTSHETQRTSTAQRSGDTSYTLHLVGGLVSSCSVGYSAYTALKDGDTVSLQSSRLFRYCIGLSRDAQVIESERDWRLWLVLVGCVLIAVGVGWLRLDTDGEVQL
jgi:hypothetical protein